MIRAGQASRRDYSFELLERAILLAVVVFEKAECPVENVDARASSLS